MVGLDYCPDGFFFFFFFLSVGIYNPVEQEVMAGQCQKIVDNMHWKKNNFSISLWDLLPTFNCFTSICFEWKIESINDADLFSQPPLLIFTKGANISGG